MIYLRTGANGSGKTLLTLRDVHEKSVKESRPVYHNGRFQIVADGPLKDWKKIDFKDWQSVPDGAIFIIDECHNDMPIRGSSSAPPEHIKMLAEHRVRGFDFYLITQHPLNFDAFVRRLIGSPGWHQHLKRASGAPLVSCLQWASVNDQPQKAGSGASAQVSMVTYPKEVYNWYTSTSLDTAKLKIPFQVKLLVALAVIIPLMVYYAYHLITAPKPSQLSGGVLASAVVPGPGPVVGPVAEAGPQTAAQYVASYAPRVPGLAYTAPRYDAITQPTEAPFPAGCIVMGPRCGCYTLQGTKLPVEQGLCLQIVKDGFFKDWGSVGSSGGRPVVAQGATPGAV